jgi:hypothetical protein
VLADVAEPGGAEEASVTAWATASASLCPAGPLAVEGDAAEDQARTGRR